jgi:hypothetical protein
LGTGIDIDGRRINMKECNAANGQIINMQTDRAIK